MRNKTRGSSRRREVGKMWFSRNFAELLLRHIDDLERRIKRLEQLEYETCKNKIASLKNEESGKENALAIEEIINKFERAANSSKRLEKR